MQTLVKNYQYKSLINSCEAPLKRHRQVVKQRKGSLVNSIHDDDEAELNAILSSDKSCRQLFSEKKH